MPVAYSYITQMLKILCLSLHVLVSLMSITFKFSLIGLCSNFFAKFIGAAHPAFSQPNYVHLQSEMLLGVATTNETAIA